MLLEKIVDLLDVRLKINIAESWDNCGLLLGRYEQDIQKILLALELTEEILEEAKEEGCNLIITHHPAIFSGLKKITDRGEALLYRAIKEDIAIYSAHTNFDLIEDGLNDYVLSLLGGKKIVLSEDEEEIIRVFDIEPMSLMNFMDLLADRLKIDQLKLIARTKDAQISRVGMVTGAGIDYAEKSFEYGADVFITGDIKYHEAMDQIEKNRLLVDIGHFGSEKHFKSAMRSFIKEKIDELSSLLILEAKKERDPFYTFERKVEDEDKIERRQVQVKPREAKKELVKVPPERIDIFTDGGSRGNPGQAAIGLVFKKGEQTVYQYGQPIGIATNNIAEYQAVLQALEKCKELGCKSFHLYLDSQLVERQLKGVYKVKNEDLKLIYDQIMLELESFESYSIEHVKRERNKEADKLVNLALDKNETIEIKEI